MMIYFELSYYQSSFPSITLATRVLKSSSMKIASLRSFITGLNFCCEYIYTSRYMLQAYTQRTEELWRSLIGNFNSKILYRSVVSFISSFLQHNFFIGTLYVNYLLYISAFRPSSNMQIHRWLYCSPLYEYWQMFTVGIFYIVDLLCWGVMSSCTSLIISEVLKLIILYFFRMLFNYTGMFPLL
jgi:hypothetical protein